MVTIKFAPPSLKTKPNLIRFPITKATLEEWNELVRYYNQMYEDGLINRGFIFTKSGALSTTKENLMYNNCCYEVRQTRYTHELILCYGKGRARVQYDHGQLLQEKNCSGHKAFLKLQREFKKDGIDLSDYYIDNGKEVKETIPKPKIELCILPNVTYTNVYHIDINQAYPYAMTIKFPEWRKTIERIYDGRMRNSINKLVLNMSYGWFQCKYFGYKLAHVSKFCIKYTVEYLNEITEEIMQHECSAICYNTDGIWFKCDDPSYIEELEKKTSYKLGGYKLDHKNCCIRFKSPGCYEYIEDGTYYPVVRGRTNLDDLKPRKQWEWGDIYKAIPHVFYNSTEEYGIIEIGDEKEI